MSEQVKLLLSYNVRSGHENAYRRFVMEEFLPKAQEMGLTPTDAWHTAYGSYPARLIGFLADDLSTVHRAMETDEWQALMARLEGFTGGLTRRIVRFRGGFQW